MKRYIILILCTIINSCQAFYGGGESGGFGASPGSAPSISTNAAWSFAVIGDTSRADAIDDCTDWITNNWSTYNMKFIINLGDNTSVDQTWATVSNNVAAVSNWNSEIPHMIAFGHHDFTTWNATTKDITDINTNLGLQRYTNESWFGGTYSNASPEDVWGTITIDSQEYIILVIGFGWNAAKATWMSDTLASNSTAKVIVAGHIFLNNVRDPLTTPGTTGDGYWTTTEGDHTWNANNGHTIQPTNLFASYLSTNDNVRLLLCGHHWSDMGGNCDNAWDYSADCKRGVGTYTTTNSDGSQVTMHLVDYEAWYHDGGGTRANIVRLYTYHPDLQMMQYRTYSVNESKFVGTDSANHSGYFEFE